MFGNVDPVNIVQKGADEELQAEIERQVRVGRSLGSFVVCTGSPITPLTPVARIRQFIDIARESSAHRKGGSNGNYAECSMRGARPGRDS